MPSIQISSSGGVTDGSQPVIFCSDYWPDCWATGGLFSGVSMVLKLNTSKKRREIAQASLGAIN